jgi:outer membrane protein assembly factor BamD (BamD/ComL family)
MYRQIDDFPNTHYAMASCHRRLREQKEAIVLYNQCKVNDKAAPRASLEIGFTYEEAKEAKNAIRTFQLTCKRYPKSNYAARAHAHLQNKYNINVTLGGAEDE